MRVLWFTNNSSCFSDSVKNSSRGGGWIQSLEKALTSVENLDLGICFYYNRTEKVQQNHTTYYLLKRPHKSFKYIIRQFVSDKEKASFQHEALALPDLLEVVKDFKPDIIHVFGSENIYGMLSYYTNIPLVLHIQGLLSPSLNSFLPPSFSWVDFLYSSFHPKQIKQRLSDRLAWERNCVSEKRMFKKIAYLMGRTAWDRLVSEVLAFPNKPCYYHCNELLRDSFYADSVRQLPEVPVFVTTISAFFYKGYDVVLKTAFILKKILHFDFKWYVYGAVCRKEVEKRVGIHPEEVNVFLMGMASEEILQEAILHATAYVHPSYIENSPNSVCEAQLLGCLCIASNVGGVASLIEDGVTGYLFPSNDVYRLAYLMKFASTHLHDNIQIGNKGKEIARQRHDKNAIVDQVLAVYNDIIHKATCENVTV